jgi:peptidoglycan lytic transglycosylase
MTRSLAIVITGIFFLFLTTSAVGQEVGMASYYHNGLTGYRMANGDRYNPDELTCAHPTHPIGSILKVACKDNPDQSVMVIVTDRGPHVKGRIIDLSRRAAKELGIIQKGIAEVAVALVKKPNEPLVVLE